MNGEISMKRKYLLNASLIVLVLVLVTPKVIAYSAAKDYKNENEMNTLEPYVNFNDQNNSEIDTFNKVKINEGKPYVNFYDGNGYLIDSYTQNQIENSLVETELYKPSKKSESGEFFAHYYDENGLLKNPDVDVRKEIIELSDNNKHKLFVFRHSSFLNNITIGQNRTFYKPESIIVEPESEFESMSVNILDSVGLKVGKIEMGNFLGGIKISLVNYVQDDSYSIQFINEKEPKRIDISGGIVIYN